jgi:hypothetical protein
MKLESAKLVLYFVSTVGGAPLEVVKQISIYNFIYLSAIHWLTRIVRIITIKI